MARLLAPERRASILLGIDVQHRGLYCRADPLCGMHFDVRGSELADRAATKRDHHELAFHNYQHRTTKIWNGALVLRQRRKLG